MAEQPRKERDTDTRKSESRPSDAWVPESALPKPNPRPGIRHRWIRIATRDKADTRNVSKRFREGWVPSKAVEYPELRLMSEVDSRFPEGIEIGGLLLCEIPEETANARNRYYSNEAETQKESASTGFLNDQHASMPKHDKSTSRTTFGKGNG